MSYKPPIRTNGAADIFTHNRADISPDGVHIIGYNGDPDITTYNFLLQRSPQDLKDVFISAVNPFGFNPAPKAFVLLHAVNPDSDVVHVNSKLPKLHVHSITGELSDEFAHIAEQESWKKTPNGRAHKKIRHLISHGKPVHTYLGALEKEADEHVVIAFPKRKNLNDLMQNGNRKEIDSFRQALLHSMRQFLENDEKGGCRIYIDEKFKPHDCLTVNILGGGNLDRTGQGLRYFQNPSAVPKP